jgi:glycosyltransferase involved in cell wall biosynthesis
MNNTSSNKVKIACIGNMNNMLFSITRYLRDKGFIAELLMQNDELTHFHPKNDCFNDDFLKYTKILSWGGGDKDLFWRVKSSKIRNDLKDYNFIIASGMPAAYLQKAGIKIDLFCPHGSDIKYLPFKGDKMRFDQKLRNYKAYYMFQMQKKAIINSQLINIEFSDPFWYEPVKKLDILDKSKYIGIPMVYHPIYSKTTISKYFHKIERLSYYETLRKENDLIIVNQASQTWTVPIDKTGRISKGSDNLIKGFASFLSNKPPNYKAKLILFEYGDDVSDSKKLIAELKIEDNIIWHPLTSRKEIMTLLYFADFACGEFYPGCIGGGTTWEALVSGTCLLHYLNTKFTKFDSFFSGSYPFVNVREPHEIKKVLLDFIKNPEFYKEIGKKGEIWFIENFVQKSVNFYVEELNKKLMYLNNQIVN